VAQQAPQDRVAIRRGLAVARVVLAGEQHRALSCLHELVGEVVLTFYPQRKRSDRG